MDQADTLATIRVDEARFDQLLADNAFIEWAQVHNNRYGTRRDLVEAMVAEGKIPLLDIDVQGGLQVIDQFGKSLLSVFLFPPSFEELERRLRTRATDSEEVIARRLSNARQEVGLADRYTYWIVNDDLETAVRKMRAIISAEESKRGNFGAPPVA